MANTRINSGVSVAETRSRILGEVTTIAAYLYDEVLGENEVEYKTATLAEHFEMSTATADDRCVELQDMGVLTRTINMGRYNSDGTYALGRFAMWKVNVPRDEAMRRISEWGEKYLAGEVLSRDATLSKKREAKAVTTKPKDMTNAKNQPAIAPGGPIEHIKAETVVVAAKAEEETRAIAGPDRPSSFEALRPLRKADDATALIEAARQYANRSGKVSEQLAALKKMARELGVEIDESVVLSGISLIPDDRLETISLVLPVIERLERDNARLIKTLAEVNDKAKTTEHLQIENRRLKARVEALVSERVVTQQRAQA